MKKGFTLIEVMGVMILLSALALLSVPIVEKQIAEGRQQAYEAEIKTIELAAENWMSDNLANKPDNNETITIMLSQLKQVGYVKKDIKNPLTKQLFANDMLIEIVNTDGIIYYNVLTDTGTDYSEYDSNTPTLILNGKMITTSEVNQEYNDLGIVAKDSNGNIITEVDIQNNVNINQVGSYNVIYTVTHNGKTNRLIRTVNIKDMTSPTLTIPTTEIVIFDNELINFDLLNGVTATDNSGSVIIKTQSNLSIIPGNYTIKYIATDNSGNTTTKTRSARVIRSGNPIFYVNNLNPKIIQGENIDLLKDVYALDTNGYAIDNITCNIIDYSCNTSLLPRGNYIVTYIATDSNNKTTTLNRTLFVDGVEYVDGSGANKPILFNKMIPVKHNGTNWVYADKYDEWYDYDNKEWANAVVLNNGVTKSVGQNISESDIAMMFVWIPRYKYTIFNGNNGSVPVQEINVVFESGIAKTGTVTCTAATSGSGSSSETCSTITNGVSTYTHPAFTFGTQELTGIWVGKFENSTTDTACNTNQNTASCNKVLPVTIKPNVRSWRYATVSNFYTSISSISNNYGMNVDSHMMKNMEWGAVVYLSYSKYGRCASGTCTEIAKNDSSDYYTGRSLGKPSTASGEYSASGTYTYESSLGQQASITGNIYGIYDMSGGSWDFVMGNMVNSSNQFYSSSGGFSTNPITKYYDSYTYDESDITHSRGRLGDATKEILKTYGSKTGGWYGDGAYVPFSTSAWFNRGGGYGDAARAGVFYFHSNNGGAHGYRAARAVVVSADDN